MIKMTEDVDAWAKLLIDEHKNPVVKQTLVRQKATSQGNEEKEKIKDHLGIIKGTIHTNRVEKRCSRTRLNWIRNKNIASAVGILKGVQKFGFCQLSEKCFYPEEVLFLLETNKVELFWKNVPLSIEQAYKIILQDKFNLNLYRIYKKILLQGFHVTRTKNDSSSKTVSTNQIVNKAEKQKKQEDSLNTVSIFEELQRTGPKLNKTQTHNSNTIFFMYKHNKVQPDYQIKMLEQNFDSSIGFDNTITTSVYTIWNNDSLSCFTCKNMDLPDLF